MSGASIAVRGLRIYVGVASVVIAVCLLMTAYNFGKASAYRDCTGMFDRATANIVAGEQ